MHTGSPASVARSHKIGRTREQSPRALLRDLLRGYARDRDPVLGERPVHKGVGADSDVVADLDRANEHRVLTNARILADPRSPVILTARNADRDARMNSAVLADPGFAVHDQGPRVGDRETRSEHIHRDREAEAER